MFISGKGERFIPTNFDILNFYNKETCFAWCEDKLVSFPYENSAITSDLPVSTVRQVVKRLRCFESRVFVHSRPTGVSKILRNGNFSLMSSAGIGQGAEFYEALAVDEDHLCVRNKSTKDTKKLFQLECPDEEDHNWPNLILTVGNSEPSIRRAILCKNEPNPKNISILADTTKLYRITQDDAVLIYHCDGAIIDIVEILRGSLIVGFIVVTDDSAILTYVVDEKLVFDKVFLDGEIRCVCGGMSEVSKDIIWLAQSDGHKIHFWTKIISEDVFYKNATRANAGVVAIKNYKNRVLVCLRESSELVELGIEHGNPSTAESNKFFSLGPQVFREMETIVDAICDRSKEWQLWIDRSIAVQDKLKRIKMYSNNQRTVCIPDIRVERVAGKCFVRAKFEASILPKNCHIVISIATEQGTLYSMKFIENMNQDMNLDLNLENKICNTDSKIRVDLVTFMNEEPQVWGLIRDYTKHPKPDAEKVISVNRAKYLNDKIAALQNLISSGELSMEKLSAMKKNIRRDMKNL